MKKRTKEEFASAVEFAVKIRRSSASSAKSPRTKDRRILSAPPRSS
ncbi:MAG: hypothetical protein WKF71_11755 [Pyrinomonadaceae bacterium]